MGWLYSGWMQRKKPLPRVWLMTDARNDRVLEAALAALPRGSGLIYRHYHLSDTARMARFRALRRLARARGHVVVLADSALTAGQWGAAGIYGSARALGPRRAGLLRLATAHNARDIARANRSEADGVLLSPVYATRSHPGGGTLGPVRFRLLARLARMPVIALGGMTAARVRGLSWQHWAAIDGLSANNALPLFP